jgi:hypothetical protein
MWDHFILKCLVGIIRITVGLGNEDLAFWYVTKLHCIYTYDSIMKLTINCLKEAERGGVRIGVQWRGWWN